MSDVTLLRKLTRKSIMRFGKYADLTVQDVIKLNRHKYLRWIYFNSSNIDFFEDVLDEIRIPLEFRISKPSKNPDLHSKCNDFILDNLTEDLKQKVLKNNEIIAKKTQNAKVIARRNQNKNKFSKDYLRRKNQGNKLT
jgi:hypothetical protein